MIFQQPPPQMVRNPHYITEWGIRGSGGGQIGSKQSIW